MNLNLTGGHGELQSHYLAYRYLHAQHGGNPRLANVDRMPSNHLRVAWIDANIDFQLVTRVTAGIHY
jgi:hypothetical protein